MSRPRLLVALSLVAACYVDSKPVQTSPRLLDRQCARGGCVRSGDVAVEPGITDDALTFRLDGRSALAIPLTLQGDDLRAREWDAASVLVRGKGTLAMTLCPTAVPCAKSTAPAVQSTYSWHYVLRAERFSTTPPDDADARFLILEADGDTATIDVADVRLSLTPDPGCE